MDPTFLNRNVNEGFSGGEKKRNEILQLAVLEVRAELAAPLTRAGATRAAPGQDGSTSRPRVLRSQYKPGAHVLEAFPGTLDRQAQVLAHC